MQKALAILEQHVQWIALGLGGVFLLFCAYVYLLNPPAVVKVGTRNNVTPGEIDEMTKNGPVREIQGKLGETTNLTIEPPDVVEAWRKHMDAPAAPALAREWPRGLFLKGTRGPTDDNRGPALAGQVDKLPDLPKAQPQPVSTGLSVVSIPPERPANGAAAPVAGNTQDLLWVTASATIPAKDIQAAFNNVVQGKNIGALTLTTDILQVELQRQRAIGNNNGTPVFPDGETGVETVPLARHLQPLVQPMPAPKALIQEKVNHAEWAEKNMELVCQPKFYDVRDGTPWTSPAGGAAAPVAAQPAAKGLAGIPPALPPRVPQPAPGAPGAAGGANRGQNAAPGLINPANLQQDILVWAFDDTVKSGQVYRYRIVYHMKNPVLGLKGIASDNIVEVLDVPSKPSDWSAPVTVQETTKFWVKSVRNNGTALADVFHWVEGKWQKAETTLAPGDRIADVDWMVVDTRSSTPSGRERDKFVLLANDAGQTIRRFPSADRNSDEYKALQSEVNPANPVKDAGTTPGRRTPAGTTPLAPGQRPNVMPRGG